MDHARISKGVPRPLPDFADFFCLRNKRNRRKKSTSLSRRAALVAQNSPNRLCKHGGFGSDKTPALRSEINLPSANFDFCSVHSDFFYLIHSRVFKDLIKRQPALVAPVKLLLLHVRLHYLKYDYQIIACLFHAFHYFFNYDQQIKVIT